MLGSVKAEAEEKRKGVVWVTRGRPLSRMVKRDGMVERARGRFEVGLRKSFLGEHGRLCGGGEQSAVHVEETVCHPVGRGWWDWGGVAWIDLDHIERACLGGGKRKGGLFEGGLM